MLHILGIYDYLVIAFYFVFMMMVGMSFRSFSKNTSDFFRGGGTMSWWMVGGSAFVTLFSAWTFVGCAGKVYRSGTIAGLIFLSNALALVFTWWIAPKFRRLRVVTWVTAVRNRFGVGTEQVYAWLSIVTNFMNGGITLYILCVFMDPVFGIPIETLIMGVGCVVLIMTTVGGAWAAVASDFVQFLIIMVVSVTIALLVLALPEVGGLSGLIRQVPSAHFHWAQADSGSVLFFWGFAIFINQFLAANNLQLGGARYLTVRNEQHARWATLIPMVGMLVLPVVAFIPPLAATFITPDIASVYPAMKNPSDAAYVHMAMKVLPPGMPGMMICAIFAASLTSINAVLSVNSGIIIKNVYQGLFRKGADEHELMIASRLCVALSGISFIAIALLLTRFGNIPLFELVLLFSGLVCIPMLVPLFLGLFIKKTPSWAASTAVTLGFVTACIANYAIDPVWFQNMCGLNSLTLSEQEYVKFATLLFSVVIVSSSTFLLSCFFFNPRDTANRDRIASFFETIHTPIDDRQEGIVDNTAQQCFTVGVLCLMYAFFICACALIPNRFADRLIFVACGSVLGIIGYALYAKSQKTERFRMPLYAALLKIAKSLFKRGAAS